MSSDGKRGYSPDYNEGHRDDAQIPATGETPVKMSAGRYLATRFSSLKPPMDKVENPITVLRLLSSKQWLFFFCAFGQFRQLRKSEFLEDVLTTSQ
jgi:SHS family lactate transporter-like MFS transporter